LKLAQQVLAHSLEFSLLSVLVEEKALFGVVAQRTHVGVALKTGDGHSLVRNDLHQNHLCTARHTAHCSTEAGGFP
jgi:hypothetical protein